MQLDLFQHLAKRMNPGPDGIKVVHGQFEIDEGHRNAGIFEMLHQLGPVEGVRFTEFRIPE